MNETRKETLNMSKHRSRDFWNIVAKYSVQLVSDLDMHCKNQIYETTLLPKHVDTRIRERIKYITIPSI